MTGTEADGAAWAPLVAAEQASPTGSRVLKAEVTSGDLSDPAVQDDLRRQLEGITGP